MNKDLIVRAYLDEMGGVPFGYGANDCALFVASYLEKILGFDPAEEYRGRYLTQEEGLALLPDGVAGKLKELLDGPHPLNSARTGDIAVKPLDIAFQLRVKEVQARLAERNGDTERAQAIRDEVVEDGLCLGIVQGRFVYTPDDTGPIRTALHEWKEVYRA